MSLQIRIPRSAALDDDLHGLQQRHVGVVAELPVGLDHVDVPATKRVGRRPALSRQAEDEGAAREVAQRRVPKKSGKYR